MKLDLSPLAAMLREELNNGNINAYELYDEGDTVRVTFHSAGFTRHWEIDKAPVFREYGENSATLHTYYEFHVNKQIELLSPELHDPLDRSIKQMQRAGRAMRTINEMHPVVLLVDIATFSLSHIPKVHRDVNGILRYENGLEVDGEAPASLSVKGTF